MSIKKRDNGTYLVTIYYPIEVRQILGITTKNFRKVCKTKLEAKNLEKQINKKIDKVLTEKNSRSFELKSNITVSEFYESVWLGMYQNGATGRSRKIPTEVTIQNTKDIFRLHILPMFGNYSLKFLNENKELVLRELTKKAQTYANIKIIKSYLSQLFDIAELLDYIEYNRITKIIRYVGDSKKQQLKVKRQFEGESLTAEELICWLNAITSDYDEKKVGLQDYLLFMLTLVLGDRKSESYALQWKHIDLKNGYIHLIQNKDKNGNLKSTKGNKNTKFKIPPLIEELIFQWKKEQEVDLKKINIIPTTEQFLFTYTKRTGELNQPVHIDYLNYRINSIRRRHPELVKLNPHKLRHTFSTLAREGGASLADISLALTHSDIKTTEIYVNTPNIVDLTIFNSFIERLNYSSD
ncbi:tyrosine-type recombinase/integrase [Vagococcus fluvialis]|uniref:tyrosine-type recombinase/integrase n=1 Tax=Vagococcus fluvialis TaxID=2738 RepID=UPI003B5BFA28